MTFSNPKSIRPEPNRRYESVMEAELITLGRDIITAKREIDTLEALPFLTVQETLTLREWRLTLERLKSTQQTAQRTAQLRLF